MTRCRVLIAAAAALVASALAPAPVGAQEADPMLGAPAVGQCYDLGADELAAAAYTEAPVDCAGTHTSRSYVMPCVACQCARLRD